MSLKSMHVAGVVSALIACGAAGLASHAGAQAASQTLRATLSGPVEKPAGDPHGAGTATFQVDPAKGQVCYQLHVHRIATATMAHIHKGAPGDAGPVVIPLTAPDKSGKSSGCAPADRAVLGQILQQPSAYYVNVHNAQFPEGAVRGQLKR